MKDQPLLKHAFKVEGIIWQALAEGRQSILFNPYRCCRDFEKFQVRHTRFWLIEASPTPPLAKGGIGGVPAACYFAEVTGVYHVHDRLLAHMLAHLHCWSDEEVEKRFTCPPPGLLVMAVRVFRVPSMVGFENISSLAEDETWIELASPLSTEGASPVMSEQAFADLNLNLSLLLNPTAYA